MMPPFYLPKASLVNEITQCLKRNGIVVLEGFVTHTEVGALNAEFEQLLTTEAPWRWSIPHENGRSCNLVRQHIDQARFASVYQLFSQRLMREVCAHYLGDTAQCNRYIHLTEDSSATTQLTDIHFDAIRSLKCMVYMQDTDVSNGAFHYLPGSHNGNHRLAKQFYFYGGKVRETPNLTDTIQFNDLTCIQGLAGTLIIFDTDGFHSGGELQAGQQRRIMRGHSYAVPALELRPRRFSRQWLRESCLNPMRLIRPQHLRNQATTAGGSRRSVKQ